MHKTLSQIQAKNLLSLLINDDEYRKLFTENLQEALKKIGYNEESSTISCLRPKKLADKSKILAAYNKIEKNLTDNNSFSAMYVPFFLEANQQESKTRTIKSIKVSAN